MARYTVALQYMPTKGQCPVTRIAIYQHADPFSTVKRERRWSPVAESLGLLPRDKNIVLTMNSLFGAELLSRREDADDLLKSQIHTASLAWRS